MNNIKMTIEYDGARYYGWQRLGRGENKNTIENKINEVLNKMTGENIEISCACRTELGVHAYGQVINFKTNCQMREYEIKNYMNRYLPMDIAVLEVERAPERFSAGLNVKTKTYVYRVGLGDTQSVFERKYCYYLFKNPDIEKMKLAAEKLLGEHDYRGFSTVKKTKSTVKNMLSIDIYRDDKEMQITLTANDFLHNMARMIVQTLLDIGVGERAPEVIDRIFAAEEESSEPADPKGLFLEKVTF